MSILEAQLEDLVIANRILAHEGVVDGFGHVSLRHPERPDRFFMSRSRSPELVTRDDIMEFDLDCNPIDQRGRIMYGERAIHERSFKLARTWPRPCTIMPTKSFPTR
jgi:ribulose-5-phosphate 4-epimerase/fuculose-1-phosphate aldolase